jgi:hypothetical protein
VARLTDASFLLSSCFFRIRITLLLVDPLEAAADASGAMQKVEVPCHAVPCHASPPRT